MKAEKDIHELILAYLREELGEEEEMRLWEWVSKNEQNKELLKELQDKDILRQDVGTYASFDTSRRWEELKREMSRRPRKRRILRSVWGSVAAAIIVAFISGVLYWQWQAEDRSAVQEMTLVRVEPGEMRAVLITGAGKQVVLHGLKDTCLNIVGNEVVEVREDGSLKYSLSSVSSESEWHTLKIPKGGEYKLVLNDSTQIWLNSESELHYPSHFIGNERRVKLTGEAYFQVAKNKEMPFIVETRDMDVKVLGTSFNVAVYPDETNRHATLVEGSVEVADKLNGKRVKLVPGEQALLDDKGMAVRQVNAKLYSMWRLDRFTFSSENMESVLRKLSRWYNVEYYFANPAMKKKCFTGTLPKYADISKVLKVIEMTTNVDIQFKENVIIIR